MEQLKKELKERLEKYSSNEKLEVGDFVKFKDKLRNAKFPKEGELGIVVRVLDIPERDRENSASKMFTDQLDLWVGVLVYDEFMVFALDSGRMERAQDIVLSGLTQKA
jgi:hypothetical protein